MKKLIMAAAVAATALALGVCANAAEYTINLGHINAENDSWHIVSLTLQQVLND